MSRLLAYGCSFTFGQGLPDTYPHNTAPSKFAWPALLGEKLNREVVNYGLMGAGNQEIFNKVLTTEFESDDLIVIMWSQFARHDFFRYKELPKGYRLNTDTAREFLKYNPIEEQWWIDNNRDRNWLTIHHCNLYLDSLNLRSLSIVGIVEKDTYPFPELEIPNLIRDQYALDWKVDFGLDKGEEGGSHPGLESHKSISQIFYDRIMQ